MTNSEPQKSAKNARLEAKRARVRHELLQAALRVANGGGLQALSWKSIGDEAGVVRSLLGYYFPGGINEVIAAVADLQKVERDGKES